jgi:hypothetical protein
LPEPCSPSIRITRGRALVSTSPPLASPNSAIAHAIDEGLDDLEIDVGLEERHPDLPEDVLHRAFAEA